ncbi:uncharacterized protein NPIL_32851 [Nephila pilipes]|uniref:Uncharacterized protein n=1 Tax=Nephila pilipes TaxID=299642 RepID=A0A8X6N8V9_NEPPI|nr:uncharacterized protein NPIL_32851 [Nephila pilipes]
MYFECHKHSYPIRNQKIKNDNLCKRRRPFQTDDEDGDPEKLAVFKASIYQRRGEDLQQVLKKRPLGEGRKAAITESGFPINPHSKRLSHITYDFHPDQGMCLPSTKKDAKECLLLGRFCSPEENRLPGKKVAHQFVTSFNI